MPKKWIILISIIAVTITVYYGRAIVNRNRIEKEGIRAKIYRKQFFNGEIERFAVFFITNTRDTVWISKSYCCKFQKTYDDMVGKEVVYLETNPGEYVIHYSENEGR